MKTIITEIGRQRKALLRQLKVLDSAAAKLSKLAGSGGGRAASGRRGKKRGVKKTRRSEPVSAAAAVPVRRGKVRSTPARAPKGVRPRASSADSESADIARKKARLAEIRGKKDKAYPAEAAS